MLDRDSGIIHRRVGFGSEEAAVVGQLARLRRHNDVDVLVTALVSGKVIHGHTVLLDGNRGIVHRRVGLISEETAVIGQLTRLRRHCDVDGLVGVLVQCEVIYRRAVLLDSDGGIVHGRIRFRGKITGIIGECTHIGGFMENHLNTASGIPVGRQLGGTATAGSQRDGSGMRTGCIRNGNDEVVTSSLEINRGGHTVSTIQAVGHLISKCGVVGVGNGVGIHIANRVGLGDGSNALTVITIVTRRAVVQGIALSRAARLRHGEHIARASLLHVQGGHLRIGDESAVVGQLTRLRRHRDVDGLVRALVQREVVHYRAVLLDGDGGILHRRVCFRSKITGVIDEFAHISRNGGNRRLIDQVVIIAAGGHCSQIRFVENVGDGGGIRFIPVHLLLHEGAAAATASTIRNSILVGSVDIGDGEHRACCTLSHRNGR